MIENLEERGLQEFENNNSNFFNRLRQIITDDESPLNETTQVTVFYNLNTENVPYFRFDISTSRMHSLTEYYRFDYNFNEGGVNNLDEITSNQEDINLIAFDGNYIQD